MKHFIYAFILIGASALFSCNGSSNQTGNADSTGMAPADTSQVVTDQPVQDQSAAAAPDQPAQPAPSSSSSSSSSASPASDNDDASPAEPEVTYQKFYDEMSPYGSWVNYQGQGYVWSPKVEQDFEPYSTNGHWVYSNDGWTWASDYKWGWAAFHYGRWFRDNKRGWLWKPGNEWGPAWVKWGQSNDKYGWAPLGVGVSVSASWNPPSASWNFVDKQYINKPDVKKYVVNKTQNVTIVKNVTVINNTTNVTNNNQKIVINKNSNNKTVVNNNKTTVNKNKTVNNKNTTVNNNINVKGKNNTVINKGPVVTDVEKVTKTKVQQVAISNDNKPDAPRIQNNKLVIYRPNVKEDPKRKSTPKNVEQDKPGNKKDKHK